MSTRRIRHPAALLLGLAMVPANATFHFIKIVELFPGTAAAPDAQYVVLQMYAPGQNFLQGHELEFFDAQGTLVGSASFPSDVANGANQAKVLVATQQAASFFGVTPDLLMSPELILAGGKVCFASTVDCVGWGSYSDPGNDDGGYGGGYGGDGVGVPFNASGGLVSGRAVLRRLNIAGSTTTLDAGDDTDNSATDFVFGLPAPRNNAGQLGHVPGATCGNGALEGLEQCDDGNLSNADACSSTCTVQDLPPATTVGLAAYGNMDFDADGRSDVLWRHDGTGANVAWRSANVSTALSVTDVRNLSWKVRGVGDFDGDGHSDVFWRNEGTGANAIWRSANSATPIAVARVSNLDWHLAGVGDFDGDLRDDLFWRNAANGRNAIWRSADAGAGLAASTVSNQQWQVVAIGDFDGDSRDDLFWRHAGTGSNAVWRSANSATPLPAARVSNTAWRVVGAGDFDADGRSDVFWRNSSTGANVIWRSANGTTPIAVTRVTNLAWHVAEIADFDGDGSDDLFWRNGSTGANAVWRSANSGAPIAVARVSNTAWKVVP